MARTNADTNPLRHTDWWTVLLFILLLGMGWLSICGACYDMEETKSLFDLSTRTGMQLIWIGVALTTGFVLLLIDDKAFDTLAYVIYVATLLLLLVTPFLANDIHGSKSWIKIGSFSLQSAEFAKAATSLALAKFMSGYGFHLNGSWRNMLVCFVLIGLPMMLIVLQHETGSALVYLSLLLMLYREGMHGSILLVGIAAVTYFVVGISYSEVMVLGGCATLGTLLVLALVLAFTVGLLVAYTRPVALITHGVGQRHQASRYFRWGMMGAGVGVLLLILACWLLPEWTQTLGLILVVGVGIWLVGVGLRHRVSRFVWIGCFVFGSVGFYHSAHFLLDHLAPHQQNRVLVLLGLKDDPSGLGYNVIQAKIAIGSGGLHGKGFLNGTQTKLKYVPEQETDFIFCTVGEEQGFVGSTFVLVTFLILLLRLIQLAERQTTHFGRVYGYCVFSIILFHILINIGMVLGLMPVIGIPLPFFSYGGSSLLGFTLLLFIFLRIDAARPR